MQDSPRPSGSDSGGGAMTMDQIWNICPIGDWSSCRTTKMKVDAEVWMFGELRDRLVGGQCRYNQASAANDPVLMGQEDSRVADSVNSRSSSSTVKAARLDLSLIGGFETHGSHGLEFEQIPHLDRPLPEEHLISRLSASQPAQYLLLRRDEPRYSEELTAQPSHGSESVASATQAAHSTTPRLSER